MNGFVNINKSTGLYSGAIVGKVKRAIVGLGEPKNIAIGHMGTLDPLACGVLPIGIGRATRLFSYMLDKRKSYIATFMFGSTTDTLDSMGTITKSSNIIPTALQIESVLHTLVGTVDQLPPQYSAKNVGGFRAYDLARQGIEFVLAPKKVEIYSIVLLEQCNANSYSFEIECGGGVYIRSIARDMAEALGSEATMTSLIRTKSGFFDINTAIDIEIFESNPEGSIISLDTVLANYNEIIPAEDDFKRLSNGIAIKVNMEDGFAIVRQNEMIVGIAKVDNGMIKFVTRLL